MKLIQFESLLVGKGGLPSLDLALFRSPHIGSDAEKRSHYLLFTIYDLRFGLAPGRLESFAPNNLHASIGLIIQLMKTNLLLIATIASVFSYRPICAQEQKPPANPPQTTGGGARAAEPSFRVVRSVSGTKVLEQGGRLAVEDPRTVFYAPDDKQIIVYFTWEGPTGPHHFEGLWKNPSGKVAMSSDFDYQPNQTRFGGYFKMLLGDAPATGVWTLEARIDGESAGSHTFQISHASGL